MGSWNGTTLGFKVKPAEKNIAKQLLICLGVNTNGYAIEEVGPLSASFAPSIKGVVGGNLLGIIPSLKEHFSAYISQFYFFDGEEGFVNEEWEDEEWEDEDVCTNEDVFDFQLDDLFHLANKLFESAKVFVAHEEGNNTSDDYYRYEAILDPNSGEKVESDCFYSYGEGINVDSDDPKEEGTEKRTESVLIRKLDSKAIEWLINQAVSHHFHELASKLNACK